MNIDITGRCASKCTTLISSLVITYSVGENRGWGIRLSICANRRPSSLRLISSQLGRPRISLHWVQIGCFMFPTACGWARVGQACQGRPPGGVVGCRGCAPKWPSQSPIPDACRFIHFPNGHSAIPFLASFLSRSTEYSTLVARLPTTSLRSTIPSEPVCLSTWGSYDVYFVTA